MQGRNRAIIALFSTLVALGAIGCQDKHGDGKHDDVTQFTIKQIETRTSDTKSPATINGIRFSANERDQVRSMPTPGDVPE